MDLIASTWMTRSLDEPVASVGLEEDGSVTAGGWNGSVKRWDDKGDLLWSTILNDRVNDIVFHRDCLIATAGLHIVCLEKSSGIVRWTHALEGSADAALIHNDVVYAVSSVYDIEHNDFIESAVWAYDLDGTERWVNRMDERPWTILSSNEQVWLGLGRPKCGFATIAVDGTLLHCDGPVDAPITSGDSHGATLAFGHADGTVSNQSSKTLRTFETGIESLVCDEAGIAVAEESGHLHSMAYDGKLNWSLNGDSIEAQCIGFTINGHKSHWFSRSTGTKSSLGVANGEDGTLFVQSESVDVRYLSCVDNRVVAGCQNGTVYVWEQGLFGRRISDQNEQGALAKDPKKTALQDRLRKLRER